MPTVSSLADLAQEAEGVDLDRLGGDLFHAGLGLAVLLVVQVLNVYKPRGVTPYGRRRQRQQRDKRRDQHGHEEDRQALLQRQ